MTTNLLTRIEREVEEEIEARFNCEENNSKILSPSYCASLHTQIQRFYSKWGVDWKDKYLR